MGSSHQIGIARRRGFAGLVATSALALAGIAAGPAAGQVSISIGTGHHPVYYGSSYNAVHFGSGFGHSYHDRKRPGYRGVTNHFGTVVYDRDHHGYGRSHFGGVRTYTNTYSRPGFFSSHGIGTKNYRSGPVYRSSVIYPSSGVSVITPGSHLRSVQRSTWTHGYGGHASQVFVGSAAPCPTTVVRKDVYVQPPVRQTKVIERTVVVPREQVIIREEPRSYGREVVSPRSDHRIINDAERAHAAGDWHTAIRLYEESISYQSDVAAARRGLALVYLETDQFTDGLRLIERAYELEPTLAVRVFDDRILSGERLGRLIEDVQRNADRQQTGRAYLAAAVLRQAAGDRHGARDAIGQAARFGLNSRVVDAWYHALGR